MVCHFIKEHQHLGARGGKVEKEKDVCNLKSNNNTKRRYAKACMGYVFCDNSSCSFRNVELKKALPKQLEKGCKLCCRQPSSHFDGCKTTAEFIFEGFACTVKHHGFHNHNQIYDEDSASDGLLE